MGDNFFLDNDYTKKQIESINNVKKLTTSDPSDAQAINGDSKSIFDDIKSYKDNNKTATNNSDLFKYIEGTMGMDNFLNLLDSNGDENATEDEISKLAGLNGDNNLTSADIDKFKKDIQDLATAKTSTTNTEKSETTEYIYNTDKTTGYLVKEKAVKKDSTSGTELKEYELDQNGNVTKKIDKTNNRTITYTYETKDGKQVKVSAKETNTKNPNEITAEYTYNENGKIATRKDLIKNTTTAYSYDENGKLTGKKITANDDSNTIKAEYTYKDGKLVSGKEYYQTSSGTQNKPPVYYEYECDKQGRKIKATKYTITNEKTGEHTKDPVAVYEYTYADSHSANPISRKDTLNNIEKTFTYNDDGELTDVTFKNKDGKELYSCKCNKDGTYASMTKGDKITLFGYTENGGIRKEEKVYNISDLNKDGKINEEAEPQETTTYINGIKFKTVKKDKTEIEYDESGKVKKIIDKNKNVTEYENGKKKTTVKTDGTKIEYGEDGNKVKETKDKNVTFYEGTNIKIEIKGNIAYVYTYNGGEKTVETYDANDIDQEHKKVRDGAKPKETRKYGSDGKEIKENDSKNNDNSKVNESKEDKEDKEKEK